MLVWKNNWKSFTWFQVKSDAGEELSSSILDVSPRCLSGLFDLFKLFDHTIQYQPGNQYQNRPA